MQERELTKEDIDKVRNLDGFPIGEDEDIIALSNAPYYTACPNPFIENFVKEYGTPYDEKTDDYHCEPFAADNSEGKSDDIYNIHTYHTKVPPKAILKYILHYTKPGDIVYDAFSGSGMTGVSCAMANDMSDLIQKNRGKRYCILNDIAVAASYIAQGYNYPYTTKNVSSAAQEILEWIRQDFGWAYQTKHSNGDFGTINYTVWSDILICPNCGKEIVYYNAGIDEITGHKKGKNITCPHCKFLTKTSEFSKATEYVFDNITNSSIPKVKEVPVLINYSYEGKKFEKEPDCYDKEIIQKINEYILNTPYPTDIIPDGYNTNQPKKSHIINRIDLFYNKRSLIVFSKLWNKIEEYPKKYRNILKFWLQSVSIGFTKTNRYFSSSFSQVNRYLKGTLYIANVRSEVSPWYALTGKSNKLSKLIENKNCIIGCSSSEKTLIPDNSIDYIFIDPPFGSNIMYSDLNIIWEAWLKLYTQRKNEAVINNLENKDDAFYKKLMLNVLKDCYRILKPNRWITIEFHNSKNSVWNIIQSVINQAGFIIADIRVLDKQVQTMKQYSTKNSVDQDLVISAYKPKEKFKKEFLFKSGSEDSVWEFVRQHLEQLPITVIKNDKIEIITERQPFLLWDRMVSYHIMNGLAIPINASKFYKGLDEKFLKRDDMYFLPSQVNEYDEARIKTEVEFISYSEVISNEKSAIGWLYNQLSKENGGAKTYSQIQPKFMQECTAIDKREKMPELSVLLEENFLQDENGKWYIPDYTKSGDIAKLREKNLLKEFQDYLTSKGKLKVFRSEALKAGFAKLWKIKDYKTIINIAERLPEETIQEDSNLLMYYDISLSRV